MIRLRTITLSRGGQVLLQDASAAINFGERIALIGPNGSGKSTLIAAICDDVPLDAGEIDLPVMKTVRLAQTPPSGALPAWRHVMAADTELMRAEAAVHEHDGVDGMHLAEAHDQWLQLDGPSAEARVKVLLAGLGFDAQQMEQPLEILSGGWRMRLNLARALFVPSELLLLDEPTNHLDLDAIVWLERWLVRYPGTVIIVSHDRDFIDRVAHACLSIESRQLVRYTGGYTACETQRAARITQHQQLAAQQSLRVAHLKSFIERFRAKATKARQVQSRIKALEKLDMLAPIRAARGVDFTLPSVDDAPDPLITVDHLKAGYPDRVVLDEVELLLGRGARVGILGRNGAGKSTLIRTLVGDLPPLGGTCRRAKALRVGYFAQHAIEALRPDESPLGMLKRLWPEEKEASLRSDLGRFGFRDEDATRPLGPMSGGEKSRLLLATIVRSRPNLLVLDEPTNNLDGLTRDALTDALADYEGALLLVSHDRYLMRATVDQLLLVHDGRADVFEGDLDDYLAWLQKGESRLMPGASGVVTVPNNPAASPTPRSGSAADAAPAPVAAPPAPLPRRVDAREERRLAAQRRNQFSELMKPVRAELEKIEKALARIEEQLVTIDAELNNPLLYRDAARATELSRQRAALSREKDSLEDDWFHASERKETLERAFESEQPASSTG